MKKMKILLLVVASLLITGCSINVSIEMNTNTLQETIVLEKNKTSFFTNSFKEEVENNLQELASYGYTYKLSSSLFKDKLTLNRTISITNENTIFPEEYAEVLYMGLDGNFILFSIDKINIFEKFPDLDKVVVKVKTKYDVVESNADSSNNGTYMWELTPTKSVDSVNLLITNELNPDIRDTNPYSDIVTFVLIIAFAFGLIGLIIWVIKNNGQAKNAI